MESRVCSYLVVWRGRITNSTPILWRSSIVYRNVLLEFPYTVIQVLLLVSLWCIIIIAEKRAILM